jgi:alkylation response protein AidB-like acyl-CoA dehydrogenase
MTVEVPSTGNPPEMTILLPPAARAVETELRSLLAAGALDVPLPGAGETAGRWAAFASWGRGDLAVARLAEGHTDAVAILAEAGRSAEPGALYGVWAARPGGLGARLRRAGGGLVLDGTVAFCSGAHVVDRALVVADHQDGDGRLLVDVAVEPPWARPDPDSWSAAAMAAADTLDVHFAALPVQRGDVLGPRGWYTARRGFTLGGGGVAAVWWGGAAGLLDRVAAHLPAAPDPHQLAHLGELNALVEATDALLDRVATAIDADPARDHALPVAQVRCAVERVVREVVERVPRMLGPGPLSRDGELARALADLGMYVRQHHGERDHAVLGAAVLAAR